MMKRFLAILLALAMLMSISAVFAETAEEATATVPDTLLCTINGEEIRENNEELQAYLNEILPEDDGYEDFLHIARMYAMIQLIQTMLIEQKTAEAFTEEEIAALEQQAREEWPLVVESNLKSYYEYYGMSYDDIPEDQLDSDRAYVLGILEANGITEDYYIASAASNAFAKQVTEELKANNPDLAATEEEIQQAYNELAAEEVAYFGDSVSNYEFYQAYYGYTFHFIPEGYRGVLHILINVEQELLDNWIDLSARLEEGADASEATGETEDAAVEDEEPVTAEMVEAARQAILDSQKEKLDDIMDRLAKGESFETLIAEYGEDPGMEVEENLRDGYQVHKDSIIYDTDFTNAAAALEKVGDYSAPVVSQFGIHIVYYLRDIPAGVLEMSEDERLELQSEIEDERLNLAISEMLDQWVEEADIVYTEEGEGWKWDESAIEDYYNSYYDDVDYYDDADLEDAE